MASFKPRDATRKGRAQEEYPIPVAPLMMPAKKRPLTAATTRFTSMRWGSISGYWFTGGWRYTGSVKRVRRVTCTQNAGASHRPGNRADDAVPRRTCLGGKNREKYREILVSGWKVAPRASSALIFRVFLARSLTKNNREGDCDNRERHQPRTGKSCRPNCNRVDKPWTLRCARGSPPESYQASPISLSCSAHE